MPTRMKPEKEQRYSNENFMCAFSKSIDCRCCGGFLVKRFLALFADDACSFLSALPDDGDDLLLALLPLLLLFSAEKNRPFFIIIYSN